MNEQQSFLGELKKTLLNYLKAKFKLYKIIAYEKIAKFSAVVFTSLLTLMFGCLVLFFLSMSAAFYFSELLNSNALGFLSVSGIYLFLFTLIVIFKKTFEKSIVNKVIRILTKEDEND